METCRLNESAVAAIAESFIQRNTPDVKVDFSSATYFGTDHHFEPLRRHWLAYFNLIETGDLVSSVGIEVRVDDETGTPSYAHE